MRLLPCLGFVLATAAGAQASARQYPLSLDAELAGSFARRQTYALSTSASSMQTQLMSGAVGASGMGVGGSVYIGLADDQETTGQAMKNVELGLSYRSLGSFSGLLNNTRYDGKMTQMMVAPGVRYRYTKFRLQPVFALHAGWFPTTISVSEATGVSQAYMGTFGFQQTIGLQVGLSKRASLGVGVSAAQLWAANLFVRWRAFASVTVVAGRP